MSLPFFTSSVSFLFYLTPYFSSFSVYFALPYFYLLHLFFMHIQSGAQSMDTFHNSLQSEWWGLGCVTTQQQETTWCHFKTGLVTIGRWSVAQRTAALPFYNFFFSCIALYLVLSFSFNQTSFIQFLLILIVMCSIISSFLSVTCYIKFNTIIQ